MSMPQDKIIADPAHGPRTTAVAISRNCTHAIMEHCLRQVVALQFPPADGYRTGFYATLNSAHFLITASHRLKKSEINEVWITPRAKGPLVQVRDPKEAKPSKLVARHFSAKILDFRITPEDPLDLLVLKVESLPNRDGYLVPFDLTRCIFRPPSAKEDAIIVGFPESYERIITKPNGARQRRLSPFGLSTERAEPPDNLADFDPAYQFLLNLDSKRHGLGPTTIDPHGMSGAPIWRFKRVKSKRELWDPTSIDICGIQRGIYDNARLIKATHIAHCVTMAYTML